MGLFRITFSFSRIRLAGSISPLKKHKINTCRNPLVHAVREAKAVIVYYRWSKSIFTSK